MISIIAALAHNGVIGKNNKLPWHLPADFEYFKKNTLGKTIVMGLNTFKSIGERPLPDRKTIILNNNPNYTPPKGCLAAGSIDEVLEITKGEKELMICGGASVYRQFLPLAQRLYLTYIHQNFEGDAYFPKLNINDWKEIRRIDCLADLKNPYPYSFVVLERK